MKRGPGEPPPRGQIATESAARGEADAPAPAAVRKPYRRPVVEKRRSLRAATLVSGGGVGGTLGGTGL